MGAGKILIAGGSGFIGTLLEKYFASHGYEVNILSRQKSQRNNYFYWDPQVEFMDERALQDVSCVINLGGVSLAGGRWTQKRKQEIVNSRMQSTDFLFHTLKTTRHTVESFISASAVGYYGNSKEEWRDETSDSGDDFLASCCRHWEESSQRISSLGIRTTIFRIGVVLSKEGGVLPLLALPVKLFAGSPLGSGRQFFPWIHHADLCNMFLKAAEDKTMNGVYNAVAPESVTNSGFMKTLAHVLHRPMFLPSIPESFLKLVLGEKVITVTGGQRVSCKKIQDKNYQFRYPNLSDALRNIFFTRERPLSRRG